MTGTPSSSQTTVLGEWRPPPSVAIFQFRGCLHPGAAPRKCLTMGPLALPPATPVAQAGVRARKGDLAGNGRATRGIRRGADSVSLPVSAMRRAPSQLKRDRQRSRRCRCTPSFSTPPTGTAPRAWAARPSTVRSPRCGAAATSSRRARPADDLDAVPAVLALQIGYDVALLELAEVLGIETDPSRFERPGASAPAWSWHYGTRASASAAPTPRARRRLRARADVHRPDGLRCRWRRSARPGSSARSDGPRTSRPASGAPCPAWRAGSRRSSSPSSPPGTWPRRSGGSCIPRR